MTQEGIDQLILITLFAFIVIGLITGSDNIRRIRHTMKRDKKKVSEMIKHPIKLRHAVELFEEIKYQKQPNREDLECLVNFPTSPVGTHEELQALNLKYRATVHAPTTIEATMTPAQLYDAGCPLWVKSYSIAELTYYFRRYSAPYEEHYEDWAVHESKNIQRELAKNGYCLDTLLRVGEGDIQWAIAKYNPEHTLNYIKTKLDDSKHADGLELVMDQINPDPKALEYLLEHEAHSTRHELAILEGKLYCGTHEPTPLEKTMTNYELYQSGSVWWMRDLTGNNVACVYSGAEELGGKLTKTDFHGLAKLHDDWDVVNYIGARKETTNGNNQSNRNDPIW